MITEFEETLRESVELSISVTFSSRHSIRANSIRRVGLQRKHRHLNRYFCIIVSMQILIQKSNAYAKSNGFCMSTKVSNFACQRKCRISHHHFFIGGGGRWQFLLQFFRDELLIYIVNILLRSTITFCLESYNSKEYSSSFPVGFGCSKHICRIVYKSSLLWTKYFLPPSSTFFFIFLRLTNGGTC